LLGGGFGVPEDDVYMAALGQDGCGGGGGGGGFDFGPNGDGGGSVSSVDVPLDSLAGSTMGGLGVSLAVPGGSDISVNNLYPDLPSASTDVSAPPVAPDALPIGSTSYDYADVLQPIATKVVSIAEPGLNWSLVVTAPQYLVMGTVAAIDAAPAVVDAVQSVGAQVTQAGQEVGAAVESNLPGGMQTILDIGKGLAVGPGTAFPPTTVGTMTGIFLKWLLNSTIP
jgi:hypothetical protein